MPEVTVEQANLEFQELGPLGIDRSLVYIPLHGLVSDF